MVVGLRWGRCVVPLVDGGIASVVVVIAVGVVHRVHRGRHSRAVRHWRAETVVVVAIGAGRVIVTHYRFDVNHHPRLGARSMPAEADRLEVFKSGETVEFSAHRVVRHERVNNMVVDGTARYLDFDSLDATGGHFHIFPNVFVIISGVEVDADVALISVVTDILHVVVDRDRVVVVHHHRLRYQGEFGWIAGGFCCDGSRHQQDAHQDVLGFHSCNCFKSLTSIKRSPSHLTKTVPKLFSSTLFVLP